MLPQESRMITYCWYDIIHRPRWFPVKIDMDHVCLIRGMHEFTYITVHSSYIRVTRTATPVIWNTTDISHHISTHYPRWAAIHVMRPLFASQRFLSHERGFMLCELKPLRPRTSASRMYPVMMYIHVCVGTPPPGPRLLFIVWAWSIARLFKHIVQYKTTGLALYNTSPPKHHLMRIPFDWRFRQIPRASPQMVSNIEIVLDPYGDLMCTSS